MLLDHKLDAGESGSEADRRGDVAAGAEHDLGAEPAEDRPGDEDGAKEREGEEKIDRVEEGAE